MKEFMNLAFASRFGVGVGIATILFVIFGG